MVINEFVQLFEIHESEAIEMPNKSNEEAETFGLDSKESLENDEKGTEYNETN